MNEYGFVAIKLRLQKQAIDLKTLIIFHPYLLFVENETIFLFVVVL